MKFQLRCEIKCILALFSAKLMKFQLLFYTYIWYIGDSNTHPRNHTPNPNQLVYNLELQFLFLPESFSRQKFLAEYVTTFQTSSAELKNHIVKLNAHIVQINGQQNHKIL